MLQTTKQRQLLVAGVVTILVAAIALINNFFEDETLNVWVGIIGMLLVALAFLWAYLQKRETWAAIGIYVGAAVAFLIFFVTQITEFTTFEAAWVPTVVLLFIALPFLWAWITDMKRWGFLIPAYVLLAIIPILFMEEIAEAEEYLVPAYVLAVIGLPFLVAYFYNRQWGYLIPGGILILLAILFIGLYYGLETGFLTIGVPIVAIVIGAFLLWRAMRDDERQREI